MNFLALMKQQSPRGLCVVSVDNFLRFNPLGNVTLDVEKGKRGQSLLGHSCPHPVADPGHR